MVGRPYRIAIIGAGPGGCTLAKILLESNTPIDLTIFEGEESLNSRTQGGTLDLHKESGLEAIRRAGLWEQFKPLARYDGEAMRITNKDFKNFVVMGGASAPSSDGGRPEIDRAQLRKLLIDSLPQDLIRWNHHLTKVSETNDGFRLHFRDRPDESGFDLIVGADGAWSHCREPLSSEKPFYAGVSGITTHISNPEERVPELYKIINRGTMFSYSNGKSIIVQQLGNGKLSLYAWAVQPEDAIKQFDGLLDDMDVVREKLMPLYENWSPVLRSFIEAADCETVARNLYMLPIGHKWDNKPGLTLLGDAAHLMGPFIGEGVNLAMTDAMKLADAIIEASKTGTKDSLDLRVAAFEKEMFVRATDFQQRTYDAMQATFYVKGAPDSNIEAYIISVAEDEMPWMLKPVFKAAVYTYYFFWRRWHGVYATAA